MTIRGKCACFLFSVLLSMFFGGCVNLVDEKGQRVSLADYDQIVMTPVTRSPGEHTEKFAYDLQMGLVGSLFSSKHWNQTVAATDPADRKKVEVHVEVQQVSIPSRASGFLPGTMASATCRIWVCDRKTKEVLGTAKLVTSGQASQGGLMGLCFYDPQLEATCLPFQAAEDIMKILTRAKKYKRK